MIDRIGSAASCGRTEPDMNLDSSNCNSLPADPGWRRKGEWRWQRLS